jgi:hypothetical protein
MLHGNRRFPEAWPCFAGLSIEAPEFGLDTRQLSLVLILQATLAD